MMDPQPRKFRNDHSAEWIYYVCVMFFVLLFSEQLPLAESITVTQPSNPTKVKIGSTVSLTWSYELNKNEKFNYVEFSRTKSGGRKEFIGSINAKNEVTNLFPSYMTLTFTNQSKTLSINVTRLTEEAEYCCKFSASNGRPETCINLKVLVPPTLDVFPLDQTVNETESIDLFCNATGIPAPNISWTKVGSDKQFSQKELLVIDPVRKEDAGTYMCTASNEAGNVTVKASVKVQYKPVNTNLSSNVAIDSVTLHGSVTFTCTTDANPPPVFKLYHEGSPVAQSAVHKIDKVTWSNRGKYTCVPSNILGEGQTASTDLTVLVPPKVDVSPGNQTVNESDTLLVFCNASGNPAPNITWTKVGMTGPPIATGNIMKIANVSHGNSGTYECRANNGIGSDAVSFKVTVNYKPRNTTLISSAVMDTVTANESVTFNCSTDANPPAHVFSLYHEGSLTAQNASFAIERVTWSNRGKYTCAPANILGEGQIASIALTVLVPPQLVISPGDQTVNESDTLLVFCNASGNPAPNITWTKMGMTGPPITTGNILKITNVSHETHDGIYECRASNGIGKNATVRFKVTVNYKPRNTKFFSSAVMDTVTTNGSVTFNCSTDAIPPAHVFSIYHEGSIITQNASFTIERVTWSDQGKYTCVPSNILGEGQNASIALTVLGPPQFVISPGDQTVNESDTLLVFCNASGNPAPNITWTKVGMTGPPIATGNTMKIASVSHEENAGYYECSASNGIGKNVTVSFKVTVNYKPRHTTFFTSAVMDTVTTNGSVIINCSTDAIPPAHVFSLYHEGSLIAQNASFTIERVKWSDQGKYTCVPSNILGEGQSSSIALTVLVPPQLVISPRDQTVNESDTLLVFCNASGNPAPSITWTKVGMTGPPIATGNTMKIADVNHEETSGTYKCSASNGIGKNATVSFKVTVNYQPRNTKFFTSAVMDTVTTNGSVIINCSTDAIPPAHAFSLYHEGSLIAQNASFTIERVTWSDQGKYTCVPSNILGEGQNAFIALTVLVPPQLVVSPADQTVNESDTLLVFCNASGNPTPNITWTKVGMTGPPIATGNIMNIANVSHEKHAGTFECRASNGIGKNATAYFKITVNFPPQLVISPGDQTVNESDTLLVFCNASGNPTPKITWTKVGMTGPSVATGNTMMIANVTHEKHDGIYECSASNGIGQSVNVSFKVTVNFPPQLVISPKDQTVNESDTLLVFCNASGNPVPNITWTKVEMTGPPVATGNTMEIANVSHEKHAGIYECKAGNGIGQSVNVSFKVTVNYRPIIIVWSQSAHSWINHTTEFSCLVEGFPTPNVSWSRSGSKSLETINQTHVVSKLTIVPRTLHDFGVYTCEAVNILGTHKQSMNIVQLTPPGKPVISVESGIHDIQVHWTPPADGGRPITSYTVQVKKIESGEWRDCKDIKQKDNKLSCSFTDVESGTKYVVRVIAWNKIGHSEPATKETTTNADVSGSKESVEEGFSYYWIIIIIVFIVVIVIIMIVVECRNPGFWKRHCCKCWATKKTYSLNNIPMTGSRLELT